MKDIKLNSQPAVEFGNTSRDILLKIDLDKEIARAKQAEEELSSNTGAQIYAELKDIEIPGAETQRHVLYIYLLDKYGEILSQTNVDLNTEHAITEVKLEVRSGHWYLVFYSYEEDEETHTKHEEYSCCIDALVADYKYLIAQEAAARALVDGQLADRITAEASRATAAEADLNARKTEQTLTNVNGKSQILNESDGGGIFFTKDDTTSKSFIGVNDSTAGGPDAQIYAINPSNNNYGAKIDILKEGIYYTVGSEPYSSRIIDDNKLIVKKDLDIEASRAKAAEATLQSNINVEASIRQYADEQLAANLTNEINRALAAEASLSTKILAEASARIIADSSLKADIDTEVSNRIAAVASVSSYASTISQALASEVNKRVEADNTLQTNVNAEASSRAIADTNLDMNKVNKSGDTMSGDLTISRTDSESAYLTLSGTIGGAINLGQGSMLLNAGAGNGTITSACYTTINSGTGYNTIIDGTSIPKNKTLATTEDLSSVKDTLQTNINAVSSSLSEEAINRISADSSLQADITIINNKIPSEATASNQLADKAFVNSSIATSTANFLGTLDAATDLGLTKPATHEAIIEKLNVYTKFKTVPTNNDYCFVINADTAGSTLYDRFKYTASGTTFSYEYTLNNSSFTQVQWAAINSGVNSSLVAQISANATDISTINSKIPSAATSANKLVDFASLLDSNVKLSETIYTDQVVGKIHGSTSRAVLVGAKGSSVKDVLINVFGKIEETQPQVVATPSISSLTFSTANAEFGTKINTVDYSIKTYEGKYSFDDTTGVIFNNFTFSGACTETVVTSTSGSINLLNDYYLGDAAVAFNCIGSYSAGNYAKTNLGNDTTVRIEAGTASKSNTFSASGYIPSLIMLSTTLPESFDGAKARAQSIFGTQVVSGGTSETYMYLIVPTTVTINKVTASGFEVPINLVETSKSYIVNNNKSANFKVYKTDGKVAGDTFIIA